MKSEGLSNCPFSIRYDQNCLETWNCSLILIAFLASIEPSAASGV